LSPSSSLLLLAKTITYPAARSLCDSWASCFCSLFLCVFILTAVYSWFLFFCVFYFHCCKFDCQCRFCPLPGKSSLQNSIGGTLNCIHYCTLVMYAECDRFLLGRADCYSKVIRETCNTSAADENMLQTVMYNAKLSLFRRLGLCPVGKTCKVGHYHTCIHYIIILDAVPSIHVVSNHAATDGLTSSSASLNSQSAGRAIRTGRLSLINLVLRILYIIWADHYQTWCDWLRRRPLLVCQFPENR